MKDLRFRNQSGTINVTFRTDLIDASAKNFTVMSITGLTVQDTTNTYKERKIEKNFKLLANNLSTFITFAVRNELELVLMNPDGSNPQILARMWDESSYSESDSGL